MPISRDDARWRILTFLSQGDGRQTVRLAQLGEAAFPHENRSAQGMALSAARVVRELVDDQLVGQDDQGYYLAPLGMLTVKAGRPAPAAPAASRRRRQP